MKDFLINLFVKYSGAGWVWAKMDGYKTYGSAALSILTGLAGVGAELAGPLAAHNAAAVLAVVQGFPHDPSWLMLMAGFGLLGVGHKLDKAADVPGVPLPNQP